MPTAQLELDRSTPAYDAVSFVSQREYVKVGNHFEEVLPKLPAGLRGFTTSTADALEGQVSFVVSFRLRKDASGTDYAPVLVAADYLREQGWEVVLPRWCK